MNGVAQNLVIRPVARRAERTTGRPAVLEYGFRIFFLLAALSAVLLVPGWIVLYFGWAPHPAGLDPLRWHAHEMLFGMATAVVAGFLLTAPGNWTGRAMPRGAALGGLAALWVAGRVVCWLAGGLPRGLVMGVDVAFLVALAWTVWQPLRGLREQRHNLVFSVLLLAMAGANVASHLQVRSPAGVAAGTEAMLYLTLFLLALMGGRVIPGFTKSQFPAGATRRRPWVDRVALASVLVVMAADLSGAPTKGLALLCLAAACAHGARTWAWHTRDIWRVPLLWVLHVGYAWIAAGFVLKALALGGAISPLLFRHAWTLGAVGMISLGMMSRVALGHTGRPLRPPRGVTASFVLLFLSALARTAGAWLLPAHYGLWLKLSASGWTVAFGIFLCVYGLMLCQPRADGQPG